ncbi:MAG TPA: CHC2 zinc finger domain-containing protein [Solirubrobacteraceae bacterium]|nr:CHC2 zinc finger domain-containing protein [Solirubrobacteraceae bacterium]
MTATSPPKRPGARDPNGRSVAELTDRELREVFPGAELEVEPLRFTFEAFEVITPDLSPAERLSVFLNLPVRMQGEAWAVLAERVEARGRATMAEERLGPCTPQELADEIAAVWGECSRVPAGMVGAPRQRPKVPRPPRPQAHGGDLEALRSIPSSEYVPQLTGREASRGYVQCPFHADGCERTPSLHVSVDDGRWHCFSCQAGGGLLEFYAYLEDREVPAGGTEFAEFVREVAVAVLGRAQ